MKLFATAALLSAVAFGAHAGTIQSATVYNNTGGEFSGLYDVGNMVDQSGLSANYVDGVTDFDTFTSSGVTHVTGEGAGTNADVSWLSNGGTGVYPITLDFDLGASGLISQLALWNGAEGNSAAVAGFEVFTSNDMAFATATSVGSFVNPIGVSGPEPVTVFDLDDTTAQYVRFEIGGNYDNGCCAIIGEVAFDIGTSVSAVPVPAALPLLFTAIGGLGLMRRRRK